MDGEVELVLDGGKKPWVVLGLGAVVEGGGVNGGDFLVKPALAGADFADLGQQVVEVGLVEEGAVFQAILVEDVAAEGEVSQHAIGPLAELGGAGGIDPEADGNDGVELVEGGVAGHFAAASV